MARFSQELLQAHYKKLPQSLKDAIVSVEVADKMFDLGKRFGLTIEKIGWLSEETGYVILGLLKPTEFVGEIAKRLEIDEDKAKKIAAEVNHEIFYPIREALKAAHQVEITYEKIEKKEGTLRQAQGISPEQKGVLRQDQDISPKQAAPQPRMPLLKDTMPLGALKATPEPKPKEPAEPPPLPELMGGIFFAGPAAKPHDDNDHDNDTTKKPQLPKPPTPPEPPPRAVKPPIDLRKTESPSLTPPSPQPPAPAPTPEPKKSPYDGVDPYRESVE